MQYDEQSLTRLIVSLPNPGSTLATRSAGRDEHIRYAKSNVFVEHHDAGE
jgi:hypothetical protein